MAETGESPRKKRGSTRGHRQKSSLPKRREVTVNVYDLLPEGRLSNIAWAMGVGIYHSGVVVNGREYAYGGHSYEGISGVYSSEPKQDPPGGRFRETILQGFTYETAERIQKIIDTSKKEFLGTQYDLLSKNCNHYTSWLCSKLTRAPAPAWLNRAASVGVRMPCVVPTAWIEPPPAQNSDDSDNEELVRMLPPAEVAPMQRQPSSALKQSSDDDFASIIDDDSSAVE